jgi:GNAT superfamily N-acetyltransferase
MVIEVRILKKGNCTKKDQEMLDRMYNAYRKEIGAGWGEVFNKSLWEGVEEGRNMLVMAVEKSSDKPLGFIRMVKEKEGDREYLKLNDFYNVPEVRGRGLSTKLSKKAYMVARSMGFGLVRTSNPVSPAGERIVKKVHDKVHTDWGMIPEEKFRKRRVR